MKMVCPNCGRRTFKRETVCPKCGTPMPERKPVEISEHDPFINQSTEGESELSLFNRKKKSEPTPETTVSEIPAAPAETAPTAEAVPLASAETESTDTTIPEDSAVADMFEPTLEFKSDDPPAEAPNSEESSDTGVDLSPEFYGSYGEVCNDTASVPTAEPDPPAEETKSEVDFSVLDFDIPDVAVPSVEESSVPEVPAFSAYSSTPDVSANDDDELVLPEDFSLPSSDTPNESKKSMDYEETVKLKDAHSAYGNQQPINEPIKAGEAVASAPKDITAIASGTARVSGDLPKLKDGQMYVAVTPKQYRRLKGRQFRGLGVLATLCLVIISAFCIWNYANSFVDPLVGVWKGDVSSANIPVEQIQQLNQDIIDSTWEFSSSGSMYLNIVVNETPISLSGSYEQKKDDNGEPYLAMTLTNPMDSTDYTMEMYYTVTGDVLEFTDMQDMGMTIDLTKE